MAKSWYDIHSWLHTVGKDRVFRLWVFKKMFTPYEQSEKFSDETVYEDDVCEYVRIKEIIELAGDYLIGFQPADDDDVYIKYYKLSEIRLEYLDRDAEEFNSDENKAIE